MGGVLFITISASETYGCFWNAYEGVKHAGYEFEESWLCNTETDGSVMDLCCYKRTS